MDRSERFHLIDQMLSNQRFVSRQQFLDVLEVSLATFKRDLEYLRDRFGAPIVWDREQGGYRYDRQGDQDSSFQLPGLWFNTGELQALLTMNAWLENLQPGMLAQHIKPLQAKIRMLLDQSDFSVSEITRRIRILTQARVNRGNDFFQPLSQALLSRRRIKIRHFNRHNARETEREISPQRLTFYRDNWYLDSWCHVRNAIRSFAVDALQDVQLLSDAAYELDDETLHRELSSGYGIFSGSRTQWAELRFTEHRSRWVAQEQWHPEQSGRFDAEGYYCLRIPYSQEHELVMDILKYGADVEVLQPASLRQRIIDTVAQMQAVYRQSSDA